MINITKDTQYSSKHLLDKINEEVLHIQLAKNFEKQNII